MNKFLFLTSGTLFLSLLFTSCDTSGGGTEKPLTDSVKSTTVTVDLPDYWSAAAGADRKFGYIDINGRWVIPPKYSRALPFSEGTALVTETPYPQTDYYLINTKGEKIMDPEGNCLGGGPSRFGVMALGYADPNSEKYVYRFTDTTGKVLPVGKLENAYLFYPDGIFPVKGENGKYGFQNAKGEWTIKPIYKTATYQHDFGYAPVETEAGYGYIDEKGKVLVPFQYAAAYPFFEGRSIFKNKAGNYGYVDTTGAEHVAPDSIELYAFFSSELIGAKENGIWGFMDPSFNWVIKPKWYELGRPRDWGRYSEGLRAVMTGEKSNPMFIYIDTKGTVVIDGKYNMAGDFKNGVAIVAVGQVPNVLFGVINRENKWVVDPIFADISKFEHIYKTGGK